MAYFFFFSLSHLSLVGTGEMDDKTSKEKEDKFLKMFARLKRLYLHVPGVSANLNTYHPFG